MILFPFLESFLLYILALVRIPIIITVGLIVLLFSSLNSPTLILIITFPLLSLPTRFPLSFFSFFSSSFLCSFQKLSLFISCLLKPTLFPFSLVRRIACGVAPILYTIHYTTTTTTTIITIPSLPLHGPVSSSHDSLLASSFFCDARRGRIHDPQPPPRHGLDHALLDCCLGQEAQQVGLSSHLCRMW